MFEAIRSRILRVLRVPPDPSPPAGAPGSAKVFRAGRNFYKLRLARWGIAQAGALVGIAFSLVFLHSLERGVAAVRTEVRRATPAESVSSQKTAPVATAGTEPAGTTTEPNAVPAKTEAAKGKSKSRQSRRERARADLQPFIDRWPPWIFPVLTFLEFWGILLYLVQIPVTYALARLDYELRWYIVTDRSLRIRAGLTSVQETTMSFANVQQVGVSQGPLQRLLGIADLRVQSAGGGGGGGDHEKGGGDSLHTGVFHGVDNAGDIRDLILERLRLFRETGLGDPEDARHASEATSAPPATVGPDALAAAQELLQEARALRKSLG
jgi:hypothetical protein